MTGTWVFLIITAVLIIGGGLLALNRPNRPRKGQFLEPPPEARSGGVDILTRPDELADDTVAEIEEALAGVEAPERPEVIEAPVEIAPEPEPEPEPEPVVKPTFRDRLSKARNLLADYVGSIRSRSEITDDTWDDLEEALIRADVGVTYASDLLDGVRARVKADGLTTPEQLLDAVKAELKGRLEGGTTDLALAEGQPAVWLFVGVNGVGKTTTIGKLGKRMVGEGHKVVMAAGDTFRAAAAEQLTLWAERTGAEIVRGNEGGDPSSVIFDAVQHAGAKEADLVLADTAGRLHNKTNLMDELRKVRRVADREPGKVTEVLLVLDATTGQNGLAQAKQFTEAVEVTGVVLTKLDGSAKGGIVLAIQDQLGIPVKLVGLGETADDLIEFHAEDFVDALFA